MNKYIRQQILQDFVYPNSNVSQYDTELVHEIKDNTPIGTIPTFTFVSGTTTGITCNLSYSYNINGAEPFNNPVNEGYYNILSVHGLAPNQNYYKPWRTLLYEQSTSLVVSPSVKSVTFSNVNFGVNTLTTGTYYFEFRFISKRSVYVISTSLNITI